MQLVRADQVFGLLGDLAVAGRGQQLRARRACPECPAAPSGSARWRAGIGHVPHQVAHQRFGHPGVHAVHAHVVAVVGGPAQRQLARGRRCPPRGRRCWLAVSIRLQRAHAGLAVLEGDVVARSRPGRCRQSGCAHRVGDVDLGEGRRPAPRTESPALSCGCARVVPKQGMVTAMHIGGGAGGAASWRGRPPAGQGSCPARRRCR